MNILLILPKPSIGGAEKQALELIKHINKKKYTIHLGFLYKGSNPNMFKKHIQNIIYFNKGSSIDFNIYVTIKKYIKENNIDIIQTFLGNHHAYIPGLLANIPIICGVRGTHDKDWPLLQRIQEFKALKHLVNKKRVTLLLNSYKAQSLYVKKGFRHTKVIPNGVDMKRFTKKTNTELEKKYKQKGKIILGVAARLIKSKNIDMLFPILKDLNNVTLMIVGDGPLKKELKQKAKPQSNILFLGKKTDIESYINLFDIYLQPSLTEGFPNILLESMACKKPVICYPAGDVSKIIAHEKNGYIAKTQQEFTKYIKKLIQDVKLRKTLAENAHKTVQKYSLKSMVTEYEKIYKDLHEKRMEKRKLNRIAESALTKNKAKKIRQNTHLDKPHLTLIESTAASIREFQDKGFWQRQRLLLQEYAKEFIVTYYTNDYKSYQNQMPKNVTHKHPKNKTKNKHLQYIQYYRFLYVEAKQFKGVIRVFGVSLPFLNIIKKRAQKNLIVSFQYDWAKGIKKDYSGIKTKIGPWVQKSALKAADYVLCTTTWLQKTAKTQYKKQNTTVIPNGVDLDLFKPKKKENNIVFVGRLHFSKGAKYLIKAFNQAKLKNYKLIIIGDGPEKEDLLKFKTKNIIFKGKIQNKEVAQIINTAKVFVLPTITMEGHPKALVEAMAAKCICLASSVKGNKDVLEECNLKENIFKAKSVESLKQVLKRAIHSSPGKSYKYAQKHYNIKKNIQKEIHILKEYNT